MNKSEIGTVNATSFEWIIPNLREFLQNVDDGISSPTFHHLGSNWYLYLYFDLGEWIGIKLRRTSNSNVSMFITYKIKIKGRTELVEITKFGCFDWKSTSSEEPKFFKKEILRSFGNSTSIICYITSGIVLPVAGREFVTTAVQTEVPDCMSCAIQTEIASKVIKKESTKDEAWSSLDIKGVALLSERMKDLLIKGTEPDVTICVQDTEFRAHRIILSARSPVFAMMLAHDTKENNSSTINIEDCDLESFDEFLLYVYSGRTEKLTPSNALRLYYTADKYDFPILREWCVNIMKTSLSVESICDVVLLAAKHQEKELLEVATEFFARNVKKILVTVGWQKFLSQNQVEANELYIKSMDILLPEN